MNKETPRTNASIQSGKLFRNGWYSEDREWVPVEFARKLELELNAANKPAETPSGFVTTTELPPLALADDFGDTETLLNSRKWLEAALEAKGAERIGGGIGCGQADIDILLDGHKFNVSIAPK